MNNNERYPFNNIHASAIIYPGVKIGRGNTIGPFCIIGAPAEYKGKEQEGFVIIGDNNTITGLVTIDSGTDAPTTIQDNCYLMKSVHVGHDCHLMNDVTVSCGAKIGGHTVIDRAVNVGLNAVIHQRQNIPEGVMIGAGAVVTKKLNCEAYHTYAGNPAKLIAANLKHPDYTIYMEQMSRI